MLLYAGFVGLLALFLRPELMLDITKLSLAFMMVCLPIIAICKMIYNSFIYPFYISPLRHLPGPSDNTFFLGQSAKYLAVPWLPNLFAEWSKQWPHAPFIRFLNFANSETLLANSLTSYREILQTKAKHFVKPAFARNFAHEVLGDGLPFTEGLIHKHRRRMLSKPFTTQQLRGSFYIIERKVKQLASILANQVGYAGGIVDIETQVWKTILDVICIETFSKDLNHLESNESPLYSTLTGNMQPSTMGQIVNYLNSIVPIRRLFPFGEIRQFQNNFDESRNFVKKIVLARLIDTELGRTTHFHDALQGMIKHNDSAWNTETLIEWAVSLVILGHDTTACTTTWAIAVLSTRQDIQQRLRSELRNLNHAGTNVEKAQYLHYFIMEVLRHYCSVPMVPRQAIENVEIAGVLIPKGTVIQLAPAGSDAGEFNPDRWSKPDGPTHDNFAFETFHNGSRMCIGKNLVTLEMKAIIAELVSRFQIDPAQEGPIEIASPAFTLRPKHKLKVNLREL
ncbi:cytochrome P450 [Mariannaea sp. PMI_226]|nr:cytochrome P450 [Mariannaea sp. PMI_226]